MKTAKNILKRINDKGFEAFIVGGFVRDTVMGLESHDIDIATNMPMDIIENMWPSCEIGSSRDFGILSIIVNGEIFEIAQFRQEEGSVDNRHPGSVKIVNSFKEDANRRDFTINSLGMDVNNNIIDFFNGKEDIENKIIRTVGNPNKRFDEDFLRMIRACRFAARFGFSIEKKTKKAIKKLSHKIVKISPERIRMELIKISSNGKQLARFIELLDETKLLKFVLPEISALKWINNPIEHHPESRTVFGHVMECLKVSQSSNPIHNIAILFHDIGKLITQGIKDGIPSIPTFHGHDKAGVPLVENIVSRLKFTNKEKDAFIFSIQNHMRFHIILDMKKSKIMKLVENDNWDVLVSVGFADNMCRKNISIDTFNETINHISLIQAEKPQKQIIDIVNGNRIMKLTGLKPGKKIGEIKKRVSDWIIDNNITDEKEIDHKIMEM